MLSRKRNSKRSGSSRNYARHSTVGGLKRPVARALAQKPAILIMDEPTSNLDFGNQITVLEQASHLAQEGMGIVMTTHDPNHALFHATSVATIGRQGEFAVGAPEAVVTEEYLRTTYRVSPQVAAATLEGRQTNVFLPVAKRSPRDCANWL